MGNLYNAFSLIKSKNNLSNKILKQTTQSALNNVFKLGPVNALSGPIERGDFCAIKKHIEVLENKIKKAKTKEKIKLLKKNYIIQSLSLLEVVKAKYGRLSKNHLKIKKFLEDEIA